MYRPNTVISASGTVKRQMLVSNQVSQNSQLRKN